MGLKLDKTLDQRDQFARYTRQELGYIARREGRDDIDPAMPADLMRARLRARPPAELPIPMKGRMGAVQRLVVPPYDQWMQIAYGQAPVPTEPEVEVAEVNAESDLEAQWKAQQNVQPKLKFHELRSELKRRGIAFSSKDTRDILESKLAQQNAAE